MLKLSDYDFDLLDRQNEFYKMAFAYLEDFKRVIRKYNGKLPSKRIATELQKINPNFRYYKEYDWWFLVFDCPYEMRSISKPYKDIFGRNSLHTEYIKTSNFQFVGYEHPEEYVDAEDLIKKVEMKIQSQLDWIEEENKAWANLPQLIADFNDACDKLEKAKMGLRSLNYVKDTNAEIKLL